MGKALIFEGLTVQNPLQTVTLEVEDEDATSVIANFSSLSDGKKAAIKTLVRSLKTAGSFNKIAYMILPIIANNVGEAVMNALTGDTLQSTTNLSLTDNMLYVSAKTTVTSLAKPNIINTQKLSMGVFADCPTPLPALASSEAIAYINTGFIPMRDGTNLGYEDGKNTYRKKSYASTGNKIAASTDIDNLTTIFVYNENTVESFEMDSSKTTRVNSNGTIQLSGEAYADSAKGYRIFTGGIKLFWASSLLTQAELVATHQAFNAFVTSVES